MYFLLEIIFSAGYFMLASCLTYCICKLLGVIGYKLSNHD